jgi:hypothetical protein
VSKEREDLEAIWRVHFHRVVFLGAQRHQKKFFNSAYMNVGRRSLGICSQAFCQVFAYALIHTAK